MLLTLLIAPNNRRYRALQQTAQPEQMNSSLVKMTRAAGGPECRLLHVEASQMKSESASPQSARAPVVKRQSNKGRSGWVQHST